MAANQKIQIQTTLIIPIFYVVREIHIAWTQETKVMHPEI